MINFLNINGHKIQSLSERDPKLPWKSLNIDVVLECTGFFTDKAEWIFFRLELKSCIISSSQRKGTWSKQTIVLV